MKICFPFPKMCKKTHVMCLVQRLRVQIRDLRATIPRDHAVFVKVVLVKLVIV